MEAFEHIMRYNGKCRSPRAAVASICYLTIYWSTVQVFNLEGGRGGGHFAPPEMDHAPLRVSRWVHG